MKFPKYSCYVISNKSHLFERMEKNIYPQKLNYFNGSGMNSFSQLVNQCVLSSPTEIVILMSDKILPTSENIEKILMLIEKGHGFVALYRFAFFGFKKELFRRIGPMDERFIGGGYEDDDFYLRLHESNISMYVTEEVNYEKRKSSWNYSLSLKHFVNKWVPKYNPNIKLHQNKIVRLLPEENLNYNWGDKTDYQFLDWSNTVVTASKAKRCLQGIEK
jgi:GT2 family glycosyltransferase